MAVRCQRSIIALANGFERARRGLLDHCARRALRCRAALAGDATAETDPCLAAVATKCRAHEGNLARRAAGLVGASTACTLPTGQLPGLSVDVLLGDDGLAFAYLATICPQAELTPLGLSECQRHALSCSADAAFLAAAPRGAVLFARLGCPLDGGACVEAAFCGNGDLDGDEECDDGLDNSDTEPDACRTNCVDAFCGDGVVDSDEDCDDGNTTDGDGCDADCAFTDSGVCGDGVVDPDEECDDGNAIDGDGCETDCTFTDGGVCGDGVENVDEECDDGPANSDTTPDACRTDCTDPVCGDSVTDSGEECDGGLANSDTTPDACRTDCTDPVCGDGIVDPGNGESCEPPGTILCTTACHLRFVLPDGAPAAAGSAGGPVDEAGSQRAPSVAAGDVARCQAAILSGGARLYGDTVALVERCVTKVMRCVLAIPEERDPEGLRSEACLLRADALCSKVVVKRETGLATQVRRVAGRCTSGDPPVAMPITVFVDETSGLGFQAAAASCPAVEGVPVDAATLLACVYRSVQCTAEGAVARIIPRAYDLLGELDLDADEAFPCVTDLAGL